MKNLIYLKRAEPKDAKFIWRLRNNKNIRKNFFNSSSISYDEHLTWFKDKLSSFDTYIFIIKNIHKRRIGYVRFDRKRNNVWKASIAIIPKFQSLGYGASSLKKGCKKLIKTVAVKKIVAYIIKGNIPSFKAFIKAGFVSKKKVTVNRKNAIMLAL